MKKKAKNVTLVSNRGNLQKVEGTKKGSFITRLKGLEKKVENLETHNRLQTNTINKLTQSLGKLHSAHMRLINILKERKVIEENKPKEKS